MTSEGEATLEGDGPPVRVRLDEARQMGDALARALNDPEMVGRSRAPGPVLEQLAGTYSPAEISQAGQVRAGEWLLVSMPRGPRWDLRLTTPESGRVGLIFHVPLARDDKGNWQPLSVDFVRAK